MHTSTKTKSWSLSSTGLEYNAHLGLEGRVQVGQERMLACWRQHSLLYHRTLYIVILQHYVLLEDFNSQVLLRRFDLCQQYLQKKQSKE